MAQRLVRSLCRSCKVPVEVSPAQYEQLGYDPTLFVGRLMYDSKGCPECHHLGYRGRVGITEFLPVSDTIKDLMLDRRPPSEIRRAAEAGGMTTLRQSGIEKILAGETTLKEVNRMTYVG
jgi:type IV pilus assembly protein PilB